MDALLQALKPEVFETFGKYAGVGGLVLACLLIFFMGVLWFIPQVFGRDRKDFRDVIKLLRMMVVCFFILAMFGLAAYVVSLVISKQAQAAADAAITERASVAERENTKRTTSVVQGTVLSLISYLGEVKSLDEALDRGKIFYSVNDLRAEERDSVILAFSAVVKVRQAGGTIGGAPVAPPERQVRIVAGKTTTGARSLQCDGFRRYRIDGNQRLRCGDNREITYISGAHSANKLDLKNIIIHATASTQRSDFLARFMQTRNVSYHLLIDRDGTVVQLVEFDKIAFHAGLNNRYGIGIGLINALQVKCDKPPAEVCRAAYEGGPKIDRDDVAVIGSGGASTFWQSYSREQLNALNGVLAALTEHYGTKDIVGHEHLDKTKADPGPAFPWAFFGKTTVVALPSISSSASDN